MIIFIAEEYIANHGAGQGRGSSGSTSGGGGQGGSSYR